MKLAFFGQIFEKSVSNFMEIRPVGTVLFLADMKVIAAFRNFANAPKSKDFHTGLTNIPSIMIKV